MSKVLVQRHLRKLAKRDRYVRKAWVERVNYVSDDGHRTGEVKIRHQDDPTGRKRYKAGDLSVSLRRVNRWRTHMKQGNGWIAVKDGPAAARDIERLLRFYGFGN